MSKVDSNFVLKVQDMFSTKSLFKQYVQAIAIRDNFQYVIVKSNKEVMILQCAIENCKWSLRASCCIHGDRSLWVLTSISYQKAWRAHKAALDDIRGSSDDSYKMLPRFAYILELNNPGIFAIYIVDVDGRFLYFFMALSASISGWQHCRPIISIDGTSLKNKYGGTLLSASTPDGQ
ncbi:protein FAR-RED ELONGATED HYPOCOTYL 3-like [Cucumis melo var. makuwa]|uniref:Protein FAR-RED ELONGATED HYPOCOTYL 3-like n=1 Tax=Cucumis melo var. makuwa TaxID=1194695 RepID=A0A5D3CA66_CUCMM|nr:protein FAR-RED ELONGATED HYPOCOTYL 3-like [Cucumis melo var. makuwa]